MHFYDIITAENVGAGIPLTYKESPKNYQYKSNASLSEMYTEIYLLVVRSTGLDELEEKFIEKLPKNLRRQLVTHEATNAEDLVLADERVRSSNRIYLADDGVVEVNNMETNLVNTEIQEFKCTDCSKIGHLKKFLLY